MASTNRYTFCVYVTTVGVAYGIDPLRALILEDCDRVAPEGTGPAKILLHLDSKRRTEIDEFSISGFVGIRMDEGSCYTVVVPYPKRVIESVTSDSVCEVARDSSWRTERRILRYGELPNFAEILAVGTTGTVVPVKSITRKSTSDMFLFNGGADEAGPCCTELLSNLKGIKQEKIEDKFRWCRKIAEVRD
ncbi:MAG: hypothetical protein Q9179_000944 [Wetmoreana sp. 5 TL-2023]